MRLQYLGVIAFLLPASVALGDGCYIPERAVRKIPEITAQHAVLSWKDGVETLVISSALDSEAQKLGWIIPLPAVPEKIEKATPGALKTLDFCIQPWITHDLSRAVGAAVVVVFVGNLLVATWLFKRKRFRDLLILLLVLFVLYGLMLPALGPAGGAAVTRASDVRIEKTAAVGAYTISILRPSRPDGLDAWLTDNGFAALPEVAGQTIAEYIAEGWVFAAIKLTRSESGANVPHPIKMVFPSKDAVYPMRLTAIAGGAPRLELFVIANDRASCGMLKEKFCDRFSREENEPGINEWHATGFTEWAGREPRFWFTGASTRCRVGHADVCSLMWDNCVLTKFVGGVAAAEMTEDIHFGWMPFKSRQEHFYTRYGAGCLAAVLLLVVVGSWNVVSMRDYVRGLVQPKGFMSYCFKKLLPAVAVGAIAAGICFALLPKLDPADVEVSRGWRSRWADWDLLAACDRSLPGHPKVLGRTEPEIAAFLLQELPGVTDSETPIKNRITGTDLRVEDSPGNFTVEKQADKVLIRVYDRFGRALVKTYPIGTKHPPAQPGPAASRDRGSQQGKPRMEGRP
jgi:hypothetical protein